MPPDGQVSIDDFARVKLRVGRILEAVGVKGSEKLLKLKVDLGEEPPRQILSGIKKWYQPGDLVNKQVIVVANLQSRQMTGLESEGMIVAAEGEDQPVILVPDEEVKTGAKIR